MKSFFPFSTVLRYAGPVVFAVGMALACRSGSAAETNAGTNTVIAVAPAAAGTNDASSTADDEGSQAWTVMTKSLHQPEPPEEWRTGAKEPTPEEVTKFREQTTEFAQKGADGAKDFYTRFPNHPKVVDAHRLEFDLLSMAVQLGSTGQIARLETVSKEMLNGKTLSEDERFEIRNAQVQLAAMKSQSADSKQAAAEYEKSVRALQKEFPGRPEVWQMLIEVASSYEGDQARPLLNDIVAGSAPEEVKEEAKAMLKKLDALGKPLDLKFTAVDGREVDLAKLKGKVVLVDFWATWCGPCVKELPNVKAVYDKLHPKGFEIVGISFDKDKAKLEKFVADQKMTWPQYFDGLFWNNKFGREFGIQSIPTMWLVDKKGVLRDLEAREDLTGKVEKYLAE